MIRIGETLRRERERQGLSFEQVSAELRIRTYYLRMMEDGRLDALPGAAYARGFVREYASFLGLDRDALGREALERLAPPRTELTVRHRYVPGRPPGRSSA